MADPGIPADPRWGVDPAAARCGVCGVLVREHPGPLCPVGAGTMEYTHEGARDLLGSLLEPGPDDA